MANPTPKKTTRLTALLAVVAVAGFTALPANAGSTETVTVSFDRAELTTEAGTQRVYNNLKRTAINACRASEGRVALYHRLAAEQCVDAMLDGFVRQIDSTRLTALNVSEKAKATG